MSVTTVLDNEELLSCTAQADINNLLAIAFRFPTEELAAGLLDNSFAFDMARCLDDLGIAQGPITDLENALRQAVEAEAPSEVFQNLRKTYTHLFISKTDRRIPLYESAYREMREKGNEEPVRFINPCALHVAELYKKAGFVASKEYREPEDHIATELEYLYLLHVRIAQALVESDSATFDSNKQSLAQFHKMHANKWFQNFYQEVIDVSKDSVYGAFAQFGLLVLSKTGSFSDLKPFQGAGMLEQEKPLIRYK